MRSVGNKSWCRCWRTGATVSGVLRCPVASCGGLRCPVVSCGLQTYQSWVVGIVEILLLNGDVTVTYRPMNNVGSNVWPMSSHMTTCLVWLCYAVCAKQYVSTLAADLAEVLSWVQLQESASQHHTGDGLPLARGAARGKRPLMLTNYAILGAGADGGAGAVFLLTR